MPTPSNHKHKFLVAYESTSSTTVRLTANDIGLLLSHMSPDDLKKCFRVYNADHYYQSEQLYKEKKKAIITVLEEKNL